MESRVYTIRVISNKCTGCALCLKECPIRAIKLIKEDGKKEVFIKESCIIICTIFPRVVLLLPSLMGG